MSDIEWTYVWSWSNLVGKPEPVDLLTEQEAAQYHKSGELYTVICTFSDGTVQYIPIRLENDFDEVKWADDFDSLAYMFQRYDGQLFLNSICIYDYDEQDEGSYDNAILIEEYSY
jgi:hypothetical protein